MAREDGPVLGHAESLRRIKQQGTRKVSTCADVVVNARNVGAGECCESLAVGSEQWDCDVTDAFGMLAISIRCAALALIKSGSSELQSRWVPGLVSGEISSTIVISEPQAGSDVGRILTAAQPQDDGSWLITGSKIWISYGDHDATGQILHLVLARVPNGESGTRSLSLFAVPKYLDDYSSMILDDPLTPITFGELRR
jgi:alkylation response protein AidB-like acyl-CoA dehydrogenase